MDFLAELASPINLILLVFIGVLSWVLFGPKREQYQSNDSGPKAATLPKMKRRDMTVEELSEYTGESDKHDGRVLVSVDGTIFDVTRGANWYGPGGPYHTMAGRDASRMLALFELDAPDGPLKYDDLSDLKSSDMDQVREWYHQFKEKYDIIGKLLKPNEAPTEYSDSEETAEAKRSVASE